MGMDQGKKVILMPEFTEQQLTSKPIKEASRGGMNRRNFMSYTALAAMAGLSTVVLGSCGGGGGSGGSSAHSGQLAADIDKVMAPIYRYKVDRFFPGKFPELANIYIGDLIYRPGNARARNRRSISRDSTCQPLELHITEEQVNRIADALESGSVPLSMFLVAVTIVSIVDCIVFSKALCATGLLIVLTVIYEALKHFAIEAGTDVAIEMLREWGKGGITFRGSCSGELITGSTTIESVVVTGFEPQGLLSAAARGSNGVDKSAVAAAVTKKRIVGSWQATSRSSQWDVWWNGRSVSSCLWTYNADGSGFAHFEGNPYDFTWVANGYNLLISTSTPRVNDFREGRITWNSPNMYTTRPVTGGWVRFERR